VTTDVSYAEFSSSSDPLTGTIIKRGGGTLTFDEDISIFTGPVHVEEGVAIGVCSNCFGLTVNDNTARDTQRTYVHSGATLVMDAIGNAPVRTEANAVYYEGDGYPGMGGAFVVRNGDTASGFSRWQLGAKSRTAGAASLYVDVPSGAQVELAPGGSLPGGGIVPQSDFGLAGQKLIVHGRGVESEFVVNHVSIAGIGDLVVSNVTLRMSNAGYLSPASGSDSAIRFRGGARWFWSKDYAGNDQRSTLYVDDMEYASIGEDSSGYNGRGFEPWNAVGAKYNWYNGPVVLNGNFNLFNKGESGGWHNSSGCTFESEVSGCGGFRPYQNMCRNLRLNLLYPTNTFEGGIVLDASSLGVYGERSVPSQEGAGLVSITNGCVYFGRKVASAAVTNNWLNFTMPVTEFVGSGAVTNGTGTWKGLVKKGAGVLDYNSQLGGDYLDLQGGTVKFNTQYREAYTGDNASAAPDGYAAALPVFTTLKGTAGALDLDGVGGSYTVVNVEGYPSVTNGNLTVTGTWTLDVATLGTRAANVSGTLTFGEGAEIVVDGDIDPMNVPGGGFIVARAASITGMPRLVCKGFALEATGGELRIKKSGFVFLVY
jgi:autotransporter-associated beta strand protein